MLLCTLPSLPSTLRPAFADQARHRAAWYCRMPFIFTGDPLRLEAVPDLFEIDRLLMRTVPPTFNEDVIPVSTAHIY